MRATVIYCSTSFPGKLLTIDVDNLDRMRWVVGLLLKRGTPRKNILVYTMGDLHDVREPENVEFALKKRGE